MLLTLVISNKKAYLWVRKWLGTFSIALFGGRLVLYPTLVTYLPGYKVKQFA